MVEEFEGEVHRVNTYLASAEELHALELREHEEDLAAMRRHYELSSPGLRSGSNSRTARCATRTRASRSS